MTYSDLMVLAPCHGLEDFPLYHTGEDAASMLACWTALWHPLLLDSARQLPHIARCEYPPEQLANALLVLPKPCEAELDCDLPGKAAAQGATLIRGCHTREDILKIALARYPDAPAIDGELVSDFFALGFVLLQVELLTQQMRYASGIDQSRIRSLVKDAARAAVEQDHERCRQKLTSCHDSLADERNHYYPVELYFLDLTLLAPTDAVLGEALRTQLSQPTPQNFVVTGETLERLVEAAPEAYQQLRARIDAGTVSLAGGEQSEIPLPLISPTSLVRHLMSAGTLYQQRLGRRPETFARRTNGMFPALGQWLHAAQFRSALHLKWDEGRMPESSQTKSAWMFHGEEYLDAVSRRPLDASLHDTFLNLPSHLSEAMDTDHVATRMFVHWPGYAAPWYDDLWRAAKYGNALGRFVTLQTYFADTSGSGARTEFTLDDYRYTFLQQHVDRREGDPISRWTRYWRCSAQSLEAVGLNVLAAAMGGTPLHTASSQDDRQLDLRQDLPPGLPKEDPIASSHIHWAQLERQTDSLASLPSEPNGVEMHRDRADDLSKQWGGVSSQLTTRIGDAICSDRSGLTVVNPLSFPRRILVSTSGGGEARSAGVASGPNVYAAERDVRGEAWALVDVPAMGFASVRVGETASELPGPNLADEWNLRNEYFQASIDPQTGTLRSLKNYQSRVTLLSQQLAFRITLPKTGQAWVDRQSPVGYSVMAADSIEISRNGKLQAEITTCGRMLAHNGEKLGAYKQRYQVTRGSRVLEVHVELETVDEMLLDEPWDSYYCCRFAFHDESSEIRRGLLGQAYPVTQSRFEAPLFVDIDDGKHHVTVLTAGLPYHRKVSAKQLDTLLCTTGESERSFRFGIGVDLPQLTCGAIDFLTPRRPSGPGHAAVDSGWLFHIDAKNVLVGNWVPLADGTGFRIQLWESAGRPAQGKIRGFRPIVAASRIDAYGQAMEELVVEQGAALISLHPHQGIEMKLHW